jgi:Histidine kinase
VAAGDRARRQIERDLHDGTQQRLVSLVLELRVAEAVLPPELQDVRAQLAGVAEGLAGALDDLQEISRGIHPAILSEGGLGLALEALARRSALPVELDIDVQPRLDAPIEVATYYVISEALANAAKHAHATVVHVRVRTEDSDLRLSVRDDGVGGATAGGGSGLIGLTDRVEAWVERSPSPAHRAGHDPARRTSYRGLLALGRSGRPRLARRCRGPTGLTGGNAQSARLQRGFGRSVVQHRADAARPPPGGATRSGAGCA